MAKLRSVSAPTVNTASAADSSVTTEEPTTSTETKEEEKDPTYPDHIEQWGFLTGIATRKWVRKLVEALTGGSTEDGASGTVDTSNLVTKDELTSATANLATKAELTSATSALATKEEVAKLATKEELASGYVTKAQYDELAAKVTALEGSLGG